MDECTIAGRRKRYFRRQGREKVDVVPMFSQGTLDPGRACDIP